MDKYSATMIKGNSKLLIRNLRKLKEQEQQNQALDLSNVIRWVAISDKLPPQEDNVLTYTEKGGIHMGKYRGTFWIIENQFSFDVVEPTHWAKPPHPPCV